MMDIGVIIFLALVVPVVLGVLAAAALVPRAEQGADEWTPVLHFDGEHLSIRPMSRRPGSAYWPWEE